METFGFGNGFLPCYNSSMLQDWEKKFNKNNYLFGLPISASAKLLPFITPNVQKSAIVDYFHIVRISISGGIKTDMLVTELNTSLIKQKIGVGYDTFYFEASSCLGLLDTGLYEFRLNIGSASIGYELFTTELFKVESCYPFEQGGDYNNDYNEDYLNNEC